ncbi:RNA recognition motif domain-containing protein [Ditylenchus destructor]|nr:RNA recognition motif domain-containing protein [Ditylenchus destructor]
MYSTPASDPASAPQIVHHVHVTRSRYTCCGMTASTTSVVLGVILGIYHLLFYGVAVSLIATGNAIAEEERAKSKYRFNDEDVEDERRRSYNTWMTITIIVLAIVLVGYALVVVIKYIRNPTLHIITMVLVGISIAVDLIIVGLVGLCLTVLTIGLVGLLTGISFLGFIFVFLPALLKLILGIILAVSLCNINPSIVVMGAQDNNQNVTQETAVVNGTVADDAAVTPVVNHKDQPGFKGNEDRKIFVGGIAYDVTNDDLSNHFSQYGEVSQAQNKQCEIKPAKSRENKKVFVGGLPADHPEEELRKHFEQYGKVEDIEWPFDKQTKARRNFAFIVFEEEDAADRAASISKQTFGPRECDVKKAVPQSKRNNFLMNMRTGAMTLGRGMYGNGMRGGPGMSAAMHNTATQWFNGWPQAAAAMHNGPAMATAWNAHTGGNGGASGWGDWYAAIGGANGAAATANAFYAPQAGNGANAFGTFGNNGYDYGSNQAAANGAPAMNRQPQNGAAATANRY